MPVSKTDIENCLSYFDRGYSCAESVALTGMELAGIRTELVPKIATGFSGGVCRTKSLCGAVAGAVLVLGARYGRMKPEDDRTLLNAKVQVFMGEFREKFGSDNCYELTGIDFNAPGGQEAYKNKTHRQICHKLVEFAITKLGELIEE